MKYTMHIGLFLLCTAVALAGAGCGYRFSGAGEFPYGVKKIAVEVFENPSTVVGLETTVTNALIYELTRSGQVRVVDTKKADAVIRGRIRQVSDHSISRSGVLTAEARRVYMQVALRLTRKGGQTLWTAENMQEDEAYDVAEDSAVTEANRRRALERLSRRLAEKIYNRITTNF